MKIILTATLFVHLFRLGISPAFAASSAKATKHAKAKFSKTKASKSGSMSMSMSVGPEPPVTPGGCDEAFTNKTVELIDDLFCEDNRDDGDGSKRPCAISLDGSDAQLRCNGYNIAQALSAPFEAGICLSNGAKATNCNVQSFEVGISVSNGGEVMDSNLKKNDLGVLSKSEVDSTFIISDT